METTLLNRITDKATKYLALVKDTLAPDLREKLDQGKLKLNVQRLYHIAQFSVLSGTADLFQPNHKYGTGWSSFIDGKLPDRIFLMDFFYLRYYVGTSQVALYNNMDLGAAHYFIKGAVFEFYLNDKLQVRYSLTNMNERPIFKNREMPEYGDTEGLNLRRPIVITPDDKIQITLRFPAGETMTPPSGSNIYIKANLFGYSAKVR